jgi:hypothetical protein
LPDQRNSQQEQACSNKGHVQMFHLRWAWQGRVNKKIFARGGVAPRLPGNCSVPPPSPSFWVYHCSLPVTKDKNRLCRCSEGVMRQTNPETVFGKAIARKLGYLLEIIYVEVNKRVPRCNALRSSMGHREWEQGYVTVAESRMLMMQQSLAEPVCLPVPVWGAGMIG